jgi:hypothetical protein
MRGEPEEENWEVEVDWESKCGRAEGRLEGPAGDKNKCRRTNEDSGKVWLSLFTLKEAGCKS